jgi:hypothetical protein
LDTVFTFLPLIYFGVNGWGMRWAVAWAALMAFQLLTQEILMAIFRRLINSPIEWKKRHWTISQWIASLSFMIFIGVPMACIWCLPIYMFFAWLSGNSMFKF